MCVYYESHCMDRCLQWSRVICLHYTTAAQPPRAIIYSDLPKHTHPETGSPTSYGKTLYTRPWREYIMGLSGGLGALDAIQHPNRKRLWKKAHFPSPTAFSLIYININTHSDTAAHKNFEHPDSLILTLLLFWLVFWSWPRVNFTSSYSGQMFWWSTASRFLISFRKQCSTGVQLILCDTSCSE